MEYFGTLIDEKYQVHKICQTVISKGRGGIGVFCLSLWGLNFSGVFPPHEKNKTIKDGGFFPTEGIGILGEMIRGKIGGK